MIIFLISHKAKNPKTLSFLTFCFIITRILKVRSVQKHHIERIIYQTEDKKFTLVKKSFFGREKEIKIHKNNMMYTRDPMLNFKQINYINMENLERYRIGYVFAWREKALFAYLIGQNIK